MTTKDMLELLILIQICDDYNNDSLYSSYLDVNYDMQKLRDKYFKLGIEFLNE